MTRPKQRKLDTGEEPAAIRLERAFRLYNRFLGTSNEISIRKAAKRHGINNWETLRNRVSRGVKDRRIEAEKRMKLSPFEEKIIHDFTLQVHAWGWPATHKHVRRMAEEILRAKGDEIPLGRNWVYTFLIRHSNLRSKIVSPRSMDRKSAEDPTIFNHWFDLFLEQKRRYQIHDADVWNMDEKGVALGVAGKLKVIIPYNEKGAHTSGGSSNREWATTSETVSLDGRKLPLWMIFKGAKNQDKWHKTMKENGQSGTGYRIATSENGWTNNDLGMEYLKFFLLNTEPHDPQKSQYRMLIVDGHDSHITTDAIRFCLKNKIVLLCLPPHTTHLLQPCDVGLFGVIAQIYKGLVSEAYRFGDSYNIDKCQFLEIWIVARERSITAKNIISAWRKSGIIPTSEGSVDRDIVLSQLPPLPTKAPIILQDDSRPSTAEGVPLDPDLFTKTPANTQDVGRLIKAVQSRESTQSEVLQAIEKLAKAATQFMLQSHIAEVLNEDLAIAAKSREKRTNKNREDGTDGSYARVLGEEEYDRRVEYSIEKSMEAIWHSFCSSPFYLAFNVPITQQDKNEKKTESKRLKKRITTLQRIAGGEQWNKEWDKRSPTKQLPLPSYDCFDLTLPDLSDKISNLAISLSPTKPPKRLNNKVPSEPIAPAVLPTISPTIPPKTSRYGRVYRRKGI